MNQNDRRAIEDYLPIQAISEEASREKSVRKGHLSTLHLWWARRPLVACRAAVFGALVPADWPARNARLKEQLDSELNGEIEDVRKKHAGKVPIRAASSAFIGHLCRYPGSPRVIQTAQRLILEAHAARLSEETGKTVTVRDIEEGRASRPKVLDMFAGGGAIPLEALRLGCDAYALDLNPVAHIIQLCTLVYPQKYGKPDRDAPGCSKDGTWAGLAEEVRHWGTWVLERAREEIDDLYPPIPDPDNPPSELAPKPQLRLGGEGFPGEAQPSLRAEQGWLTPVAYLWTRTVPCKNPSCGATVPLVRQTWLCKKPGRYGALKMLAPRGEKRVRFEGVEAASETGLGFDPAGFSKGGNATCPFCGTVADIGYVKTEGCGKRIGQQLMTVVCAPARRGEKRYLDPDPQWEGITSDPELASRAEEIAAKFGITVPSEPVEANPRSFDVQHFGFASWRDVFTPRQLVAMTAFAGAVKAAHGEMLRAGYDAGHAQGVTTCLSMVLGRLADYCTSFCTWQPEFIKNTFNSPGMPMVMDYAEANPLEASSGGWPSALEYVTAALADFVTVPDRATVLRGSALTMPWQEETFDAVVTDPPYYDSRSYSNLADHFYVWHKRAIGDLYPEHFTSELTPKKSEAIAAPYRHGGVRERADAAYEAMMRKAFEEARRVLKPGMPMVCVYAHKTTAGWATLINSLRLSGFTVVEAWPVEMERKTRQNAQETGALASSIFLVARKREGAETGQYEEEVRPELEQIVRERVETLWDMGIAGADLIIAAVGAGLCAFTRFARVEYANGEEVPAEKFLTEVEGVVLEILLEKIFGVSHAGVAAVDGPSRFYVLWRYTYGAVELEAGEAIVFTYGQPVELDGPKGLSAGSRALVEKKKGKYRLHDYTEHGQDEKLGLPGAGGRPAPLMDVLHRLLWLMEHEPRKIAEFLDKAEPDRERLRLVAQALAGAGLKGKSVEEARALVVTTASEQSALGKLTANWRTLIEQQFAGSLFDARSG